MADPAVVRAVAFYAPVAAVAATIAATRPDRRRAGAALLATLWNLAALLAVNVVAVHSGWWRFDSVGGELAGVPVDAWLGWALLWGALPALLPRGVPAVAVVTGLVWADLLLMPLGQPVLVLGPGWLAGEALAVGAALVPGLVLARATTGHSWLAVRAVMQVVLFTTLIGWVATSALLEATGGRWAGHLDLSRPTVQAALELIALLSLPALAAVAELARRGGGTPYPFDPPPRLVTSGPYAYAANPMQLSMTLVLVAWGAALGSWAVVLLAVVGAAFAAGIAGWHETVELEQRFGDDWHRYRHHVRTWRPRWRPWPDPGPPAVLYVAPGCDPCDGLGRWLGARQPVALEIRSAAESPRPLTRLTYVGPDGLVESGVAAFGRALQHLHLAWALLGWLLLLPGLNRFVQLVVDAVGGGPLAEPLGGPAARPMHAGAATPTASGASSGA
ncbi:MAG: methyltransferase family protein [Acidimicrobiales bacterium]